jgi:hypothetical protein
MFGAYSIIFLLISTTSSKLDWLVILQQLHTFIIGSLPF